MRRPRRTQRLAQAGSLIVFLYLILQTAWPLPAVPVDIFLRLDPLAAVATPMAAREITGLVSLWPGLALLILTILAGRIFCGYCCPLGASLDFVRFALLRLAGRSPLIKNRMDAVFNWKWNYRIKFLILALILGSALAGVSLLFWASPISLATRLYALVIHPLALLTGQELLRLSQFFPAVAELPGLAYAQIPLRRFDTMPFVAALFALLFALELVRPRFWCRCLCPAGALLALCAARPFWRRRIRRCVRCGLCAEHCPTGALAPSGVLTRRRECIACRTCVEICPTKGIVFSLKEPAAEAPGPPAAQRGEPEGIPSRRAFLAASGAGAVLAALQVSRARSLLQSDALGLIWPADCIRPPGALPEPDFLARCLRCGLCMKACPSNALQPAWLTAGPEGMFSPLLTPRRGPCAPDCRACGEVCPTHAILPLPPEEKFWAKVGTAVVDQGRCLAWTEGRSCVVCEEVCPYGAVGLTRIPGGQAPAPVVRPGRCFGCGYCEYHCPVRLPAIVVQPLGALRLTEARYAEAGRAAGLSLSPAGEREIPQLEETPAGGLPPGFSP
ncbi:MAG: 4Fe-4S binding protein [Desulfovibrio sp.]|jgi:MauM/NapG family ferredoxin protein|nr:4Fe-4S binding protein [Desulfovibrio sp.]